MPSIKEQLADYRARHNSDSQKTKRGESINIHEGSVIRGDCESGSENRSSARRTSNRRGIDTKTFGSRQNRDKEAHEAEAQKRLGGVDESGKINRSLPNSARISYKAKFGSQGAPAHIPQNVDFRSFNRSKKREIQGPGIFIERYGTTFL